MSEKSERKTLQPTRRLQFADVEGPDVQIKRARVFQVGDTVWYQGQSEEYAGYCLITEIEHIKADPDLLVEGEAAKHFQITIRPLQDIGLPVPEQITVRAYLVCDSTTRKTYLYSNVIVTGQEPAFPVVIPHQDRSKTRKKPARRKQWEPDVTNTKLSILGRR